MGTKWLVVVIASVVLAAACSDEAGDSVQVEPTTALTVPSIDVAAPDLVGSDGPPPLQVDTGGSTVATHGFDYCWDPGGCADSFGAEIPTPIDVDAPSVLISWIDGGVLSAWYRANDHDCSAHLSLEPVGPGTWSLAIPPESGTHRIDFHGQFGEGSTRFALLVSASVAGPPLLPIASVWLPDTNDSFVVGAELHEIDPDSEARVEIVSADGISTVLHMQLYAQPAESECVQWVEGESTVVEGIRALGAAPFQATLLLLSATEQYEMSWEWPRDAGPDYRATRTLHPSADSPITEAHLVGAGWSFGMCAGFCLANLEIDKTQASLAGWSREGDEPIFVNEGLLTEQAVTQINSKLDTLDGVVLEPVYGCPDCADGGAAYLALEQDGPPTRYSMDLNRPPNELAGLYETAFAIVEALTSCQGNDLVVVSETCQPQQR